MESQTSQIRGERANEARIRGTGATRGASLVQGEMEILPIMVNGPKCSMRLPGALSYYERVVWMEK